MVPPHNGRAGGAYAHAARKNSDFAPTGCPKQRRKNMRLLGRAQDPKFWSEDVRNKPEFERYRTELLKYWEKNDLENKRFEALRYSEFKLFWTTGDREKYQGAYFGRRTAIEVTVPLCLIYPEEEKYINKLMDLVYSVCDEYTWCLPAHQDKLEVLNEVRIDLFASECAFYMAMIYTLLGDRLDPLINERIKYETQRRVIDPFLAVDCYGWWETGTSNWTSVCIGSVAGAMMLLRPDLVTDEVVARFEKAIDGYLRGFKDDGVCFEGCGYWAYGFGYFLQYADLIRTFTGGRVDRFADPKVKTIATFLQKMFLSGDAGVSFADGGKKISYDTAILHRLKTEYPDDVLIYDPKYSSNSMGCGRLSTRVFAASWMNEDFYNNPAESGVDFENWFADSKWFVKRNRNYGFAAKAGHNAELHNHNDVGSFIFAKDGEQLLCDLGSGLYTRQYFGPERYTILECSSLGHSVPVVNGVAQGAGAKFTSTDARYENGVLSMEMAKAYPVAEIESLKRSFTVKENGVVLRDEFVGEASIVERLVTLAEPVVEKGVIKLKGATVTFNPEYEVKVTVTEGTAKINKVVYLIDFILPAGATAWEIEMK